MIAGLLAAAALAEAPPPIPEGFAVVDARTSAGTLEGPYPPGSQVLSWGASRLPDRSWPSLGLAVAVPFWIRPDGDGALLIEALGVTDSLGWDIDRLNVPGTVSTPPAFPIFVSNAFYYDAGGEPGSIIDGCDFPANTDFLSFGDGDIAVNLDCNAPSGPTWVSQTVRMDVVPFGEHFC